MGRRLFFTAAIATAAALVVPVAALALHVDPAASSPNSLPSLITVASSPPTTFLPVVGGDAVRVRIPSIVMVKVDDRGHVVAVATNSGRAPRQGDLVYLYGPDGSVRRTTAIDPRRHWRGDFTRPAVFQAQASDDADHGDD